MYFASVFNGYIVVGCETHFFFIEMEKDLDSIVNGYFLNSNYSIIEFVLRGDGGTKVAEIFVDNETGINIDDLTKINKDLNELVDTNLVIKDISKLVVSSPGAERPFKFLWQLRKHIGRTIEAELIDGEKVDGKLVEISDDSNEHITFEIHKKEKGKKLTSEIRIVDFKDIKESKVKISFSK